MGPLLVCSRMNEPGSGQCGLRSVVGLLSSEPQKNPLTFWALVGGTFVVLFLESLPTHRTAELLDGPWRVARTVVGMVMPKATNGLTFLRCVGHKVKPKQWFTFLRFIICTSLI